MPSSHLSSSNTLFFCPQSFPASGTFPLSHQYASDDWNTGASASASVLTMSIQFICLKIEQLDLLSVQGTLRSLLQHHSSKASILWCFVFFTIQLLQPYMNTGKTIALNIWTFVGRVMSLLFNTLSRFLIAFLLRSNHLLISRLQSPSTVILEPKKRESFTTFTFFPSICHVQYYGPLLQEHCLLDPMPWIY